jgi:hypothetical protein
MPDKWEYPWFASFNMMPFSKIDPDFAKHQLILFLREWSPMSGRYRQIQF